MEMKMDKNMGTGMYMDKNMGTGMNMDMGMDMNMTMNMNMNRYFKASSHLMNFLFKDLNTSTTGVFIGVVVVVGLITVLYEVLRLISTYCMLKRNQNPLTYGKTPENIQDRNCLLSSLIIPATLKEIKQRRFNYHLLQTITHIITIFTGYLIMLAVMSYNVWVLIAVALGSGMGFFVFGAIREEVVSRLAPKSTIQKSDSVPTVSQAVSEG